MNKTKFAALALSFAVAASPFGAAAAEGGHWAQKSLERLAGMGILTGDDEGNLLPDNKITRAELFTMLNRAAGITKISGLSFTDVAENAWYKNQADMAVTAGYAAGYGDGSIHPDDYVTRAEAATMLYRVFYAQGGADVRFADGASIPDWAAEAVAELSALKLISGYEDGTFKPNDPITRAEVCTILDRAIGKRYVDRNDLSGETVEGNLVITASNYNIENVTVNGNIYVTNTGENGELRFKNCRINGYIYYGANNTGSLVLDGTSADKIISGGQSRIVLTGKANIGALVIKNGAEVSALNYDGTPIESVRLGGNCTVGADVKEVIVNAKANVTVSKGFNVQKLVVESTAGGSSLTVDGTVGTLECRAGATVNGRSVTSGYTSQVSGSTSSDGSLSYKPSGGSGGGGGGGSSSGGSNRGEDSNYSIKAINPDGGYSLTTPFDENVADYAVYIDYDVSEIAFSVDYTLGARVRVNDTYVSSGERYVLADIPHGASEVKIELLDGLDTLKTYKLTVHREYEAQPEKLAALNEIMRTTADADADAVKILTAMGEANIGDATIILTGKYKEEYDRQYTDTDLTQKQFAALVKKVNEENKEILSSAIGIKADGGHVFAKKVSKDTPGMYEVTLKYAALSPAEGKTLAIYANGKKYESESVDLSPLNGWTETKITVRLDSGENEIEVYAESANDGNYGLIVDSAKVSENKVPVKSVTLLAKDYAKAVVYKGKQWDTYIGVSSGGGSIYGGSIIFRFNNSDAQKATIKVNWSPNNEATDFGTLAFFNPVKVIDISGGQYYTGDMTEGVDYPAQSDAVMNIFNTAEYWRTGKGGWSGSNYTWCETELKVELQEGENVLWFPAYALGYYDPVEMTVKPGPYVFGSNNTKANGQTLVYSIEIVPESFELE